MKYLLTLAVLTVGLVGCSSSSKDDGEIKPGSGVALNPSGKPQNAEQEAYQSQMAKAGANINDARAREAEAMAQAKARAGGG